MKILYDELYKEELFKDLIKSHGAKEVSNYRAALRRGFEIVKDKGLLTSNDLIDIHETLEMTRTGFRRQPGTELKNDKTGQTV